MGTGPGSGVLARSRLATLAVGSCLGQRGGVQGSSREHLWERQNCENVGPLKIRPNKTGKQKLDHAVRGSVVVYHDQDPPASVHVAFLFTWVIVDVKLMIFGHMPRKRL